jgi:hypothetical protein
VTELEWQTSSDPRAMFRAVEDRITLRECRFITLACGRRHCAIQDRARDSDPHAAETWLAAKPTVDAWCDRVLRSVEAALDGLEPVERAKQVFDEFREQHTLREAPVPIGLCWDLSATLAGNIRYWLVERFPELPQTAREQSRMDQATLWKLQDESTFQADVLRDVLGDSPSLASSPALAFANEIVALAGRLRDERRYDLSALVPALRQHGCDDAGLMRHCESNQPHVRGCWVLERILGRGKWSGLPVGI